MIRFQGTHRVDNFGAGPAMLPRSVLEKAQQEFLDYNGQGMSIMEFSHRSKTFESTLADTKANLRALLGIPDTYDVLFLQGGASLQFAMIPLNFLKPGQAANYVLTGAWSEKAYDEACLVGMARVGATGKDSSYSRIPASIEWSEEDSYVHLTSNNTIYGTEWHDFPDTQRVPLVADMSSDLLARRIPVENFQLIYAGAQKNLGPSGVTVVIVESAWLERAKRDLPTMLRYDVHAKNKSLYNTPPTFSIYLLGEVLKWAKEQGGIDALEARNRRKAARVYGVIDAYGDFYRGHAEGNSRSLMNITFRLPSQELEREFLSEAETAGFVGLAGHRSVGGIRASLYNGVNEDMCGRLCDFMVDFQRKYG